jgi:RimJ/RimL family protein N-acetyltransferase
MRLETERLVLQPLSENDLEPWAEVMADAEARRLLHTPEPVADGERVTAGLRRWVSLFREPVGMYTATVAATGEAAGFVGFVPRELPWGDEIELGWLLLRRAWGRGYTTEAARALRPLVPGRVISLIRVEHDASANVARKLGMSIEGEIELLGFETNVWVSERTSAAPAGS